MSIIKFAEQELALLNEEGEATQNVMNDDIMELVKVFAAQGHSGFTAAYVLGILPRLLDYKPISALTGEDDEWSDPLFGDDCLQQNKRCSAVFRRHYDNSTAYYIYGKVFSDDGGQSWYTSRDSSIPITFPYHVPDEPAYIILDGIEETEDTE